MEELLNIEKWVRLKKIARIDVEFSAYVFNMFCHSW